MRYPTGTGTQADFDKNWYNADEWDSWRVEGSYYHGGSDVNKRSGGNTDCGEAVYAVADGEITHNESINTGFGKHIHHKCVVAGQTVWFHYCHLQEYYVKAGDKVKEGQLLGRIGTTGNSKYCHLHFEGKKKAVGVRAVAKTKQALLDGWFDALAFIKTNINVQSTPEIPAEVSMPDELQGLLEYYKVKSVSELKTMVDTQLGYLSDERKKTTNLQAVVDDNNRHMEELSTKLSTTCDYPAILAEVTQLLAVEEVNHQLEKKLDSEEKKHDQERNQLIDRVDQLQKAVEESQRNSERLLIELDAVKTKLNGLEAQGAFLTRFQSILQSIFKRTV